MPKYIGLPYKPKERSGPIDRLALAKTFDVDNPELDRLLTDLIERINTILAMVWENRAREAHDLPYTDADGSRTNIGDAMESLEGTDHARLHDIDSTDDHNGVSGATEDNFASFDANGLPKDSGSAAGSFDAAGSAASAVSDHEAAADPHPGYLTPTEGDAAYDAAGSAAAVASDLSDHESDTGNPHGVTAAQANAIPVEASSTDNAIVRWDGTGGDAVQDSGILVDDDNHLHFDSTAWINYNDVLAQWQFIVGSSLRYYFDADWFYFGGANGVRLWSVDPQIQWASGDYCQYDETADAWNWYIDSTQVLSLSADRLRPALPIQMDEVTAPTNAADTGFIYTKDDSGDTELYYMDAAGNEVKLTEDGAAAGSADSGGTRWQRMLSA
jgi:hypothetical protein